MGNATMKTIIDSHEIGLMIELYEDGSARLVSWSDGDARTVENLQIRGAFSGAALLLDEWGKMFTECARR
jgi:hypothetical protein